MHINRITTPVLKIADCVLDDKRKFFFNLNWEKAHYDFIKDSTDRIYVITENSIIKKIGGSACEDGFKGTMTTYRSASRSGKPSVRSIGIPLNMYKSMRNNNKIEIYGFLAPKNETQILGLFNNYRTLMASVNYKYYEKSFLDDYFQVNQCYPEWNYQEQGKPWDFIAVELHRKYHNEKYKLILDDVDNLFDINENTN